MRILLFLVAAAIGTLTSCAQASDKEANAVYERMQAAYASLDASGLETVYAHNATYLPRSAKAGVNDRATIRRGLKGFIDQVQGTHGKITVSFRVVERKRFKDIYIDNGYVRTIVDKGDGSAVTVSIGKFLTAIARQPEGHWAFVSDSDSETPPASFDTAKPLSGVKFDQ